MKVDRHELGKVSYLRADVIGERAVPLQPYFDGVAWHLWVPRGDGTLGQLQTPEFCQGRYFAKQPARVADGIVDILQFITKYAYFDNVAPIAHAFEHDVLNLSAALWKVDLQFELATKRSLGSAATAATDVEYVLVACRSLIDLVQQTLRALWRRVELLPASGQRHRAELPRSMGDVLAKGQRRRATTEIREKFHLPDPIVEFYERSSAFVLGLRSARDAIVHLPTETPFMLVLDDGFAVPVDRPPFRDLVTWDPKGLRPNRLGSLRCFLAQVVLRTLRVGEDLAATLKGCLSLPDDVAPGLGVFLRSDYVAVLHRLQAVADSGWEKFAEIDVRMPSL